MYALVADFAPDIIRYVGRTKYADPSKRLSQHLHRPNSRKSYKNNWIVQTLEKGKVLAIVLEANLTFEESVEREIYWIAFYKNLGHKITNLTIGGEGTRGYKASEETKEKLRLSHLGNVPSLETREKLRLANKGERNHHWGKKQHPEWAAKSRKSALGYRHTVETRAKISESNRKRERSEESKERTRTSMKKYFESQKEVCSL